MLSYYVVGYKRYGREKRNMTTDHKKSDVLSLSVRKMGETVTLLVRYPPWGHANATVVVPTAGDGVIGPKERNAKISMQ